MLPFSDPQAVARYAQGPPRIVPGFADFAPHERPAAGRAHAPGWSGAGGGLELKAFAEAQPGWQFAGVDPAAEMRRLAEATLGPLAARRRLHKGYIAIL